MTSRYGSLFQIEDFVAPGSARRLERLSLNGTKASSGYDEAWLQRLIAQHPQALPIAEIEPFLEGAVPVCLELDTKAGPIDLLLVSPKGDIVIVECKLWRNPQARREVVGQILDYAKELPRLSYEAFEDAIRKAEPAAGASHADSLYQRVGGDGAGLAEKDFSDAVSRNLRRGRFLLLIVDDGIQEGVEAIADFLQQHAGMHFTLALVEIAIFKSHPDGFMVQPRILAKTVMVPRGVVLIEDGHIAVHHAPYAGGHGQPNAKTQASAPATISEARLYELLDAKEPGLAASLRAFVAALEDLGETPRFTPTMIVLKGVASERTLSLAHIHAEFASVWFGDEVSQATALGRRDAALAYYRALASLIQDKTLRAEKLSPSGSSGVASLPLKDLLSRQNDWLEAAKAYLQAFKNGSTSAA